MNPCGVDGTVLPKLMVLRAITEAMCGKHVHSGVDGVLVLGVWEIARGAIGTHGASNHVAATQHALCPVDDDYRFGWSANRLNSVFAGGDGCFKLMFGGLTAHVFRWS